MTLEETWDKEYCEECGEYDYVWELRVKYYDDDDSDSNGYVQVRLCKKCLLKLMKLIVER